MPGKKGKMWSKYLKYTRQRWKLIRPVHFRLWPSDQLSVRKPSSTIFYPFRRIPCHDLFIQKELFFSFIFLPFQWQFLPPVPLHSRRRDGPTADLSGNSISVALFRQYRQSRFPSFSHVQSTAIKRNSAAMSLASVCSAYCHIWMTRAFHQPWKSST